MWSAKRSILNSRDEVRDVRFAIDGVVAAAVVGVVVVEDEETVVLGFEGGAVVLRFERRVARISD